MKQILVMMMAAVVLVGQSVVADEKLIADPIVEKAVRGELEKPEGKLTEADLEKVTSLALFASKINDVSLKDVAKLKQLEILLLDNTEITDAGLQEIAKLKKLRMLDINFTKVSGKGVLQLRGKLTKCRIKTDIEGIPSVIVIADPIVKKAVREELKKPKGEFTDADFEKVVSLSFRKNEITDEGLKEVAKLQNLYELALVNNTKISDEGLKEVAKLQKLEGLILYANQITNVGLKEVAKLQNLGELYLSQKISDEGLKEVAKLQKLTHLSLSDTEITDEGLKDVAKLQKLLQLWLIRTKVTDAGVAELKKALPNCEISR